MGDRNGRSLIELVDELAGAAARCGLKVRREKILREVGYRARGGACRVRGNDLIIMDREQPAAEQLDILFDDLRGCDLETLYLSPAARRLLQAGADRA
jgi:hypothetical protein